MVRMAPRGGSRAVTVSLPGISRPDKGHQWCRRNGRFFKAQDDESRLVGHRKGIERRLLQKAVKLTWKVRRDLHIRFKGTPEDLPPHCFFDQAAAGCDPSPPSREPTLEVRHHRAIPTDDETYKLVDRTHLAGCDAQSRPCRGDADPLVHYGIFCQSLHGVPSHLTGLSFWVAYRTSAVAGLRIPALPQAGEGTEGA